MRGKSRGGDHAASTGERSSELFKRWLSSAIWNAAKTYWRTRKREHARLIQAEDALEQIPDRMPTPDDDDCLRANEQRVTVAAWMSELPLGAREVVFLRYWCDLSEVEAARELGITRWTCNKRHLRALRALRAIADKTTSGLARHHR